MTPKKSNFFRILFIPDVNSKIRQFRLSRTFFRFLFVLLALFVAVITILFYNLVITRQELEKTVAEIERVEERINYEIVNLLNLEKQAEEIEVKTKILENYINQVEDLDKLVRDITGEGGFEEQVAVYSYDLTALSNPDISSSEIFYYTITADQEQELDDISKLLDEMLAKAPDMSVKLSEDKLNMENYIFEMEHTPNIWPTWGKITTLFCDGRSKVWRSGLHKGIDIANHSGTSINTTASGVVIYSGWHAGYGKKVIIHHGFGYTTVYAHLRTIYVDVGDEVIKGDRIGLMGSTGRSSGTHLHYELYVDGIPVNPYDFLP
jgi:murein DD-endopeptidase MepM/ murein hydrolase activator NlpD